VTDDWHELDSDAFTTAVLISNYNIEFRYYLLTSSREFTMKRDILYELFMGFVKVHVLYHASQEPVYGAWLKEELAEHGYEVSPGTLYPMLHTLQEAGLLQCERRIVGGRTRKYYRTTAAGERVLAEARRKAVELVNEIIEAESHER
jgi:PadR family transcriptional regulator, regulatory protein PadR